MGFTGLELPALTKVVEPDGTTVYQWGTDDERLNKVRLVDSMGSDYDICVAARVSTDTEFKAMSDQNVERLIDFLMRNRHQTPFEQAELIFLVDMPIVVARQWVRHRTAHLLERSMRYSGGTPDTLKTAPNFWRSAPEYTKIGSGECLPVEVGIELSRAEEEFLQGAWEIYQERLEAGVAQEQARKDLPLCTYTRVRWKIDLHNCMNFLRQRLDEHAQLEIREFANVIWKIIQEKFPVTAAAFENYVLRSMTLSGRQVEWTRSVLAELMGMAAHNMDDGIDASCVWPDEDVLDQAIEGSIGWAIADDDWNKLKETGEFKEWRDKLKTLLL